ncbi:MAG TPA: efflux transporter outer membrane subunit [Steroidobacteraceae bacterium]|nr:efflux transporter outer membrane subunit [Steroidobacteraceae bacterium]
MMPVNPSAGRGARILGVLRGCARLGGVLLGGVLPLAGCVMLPPHPTAYAPVAAGRLGLSGAAVRPAPDTWWRALGDQQLDALMAEALSGNPTLAEANARWQSALAQAAGARAAQLPDARLRGGETALKVPDGFGPYLLGGHDIWLGNLGAVLSWDPDLAGEHADQAAAARSLARAAELDRADARLLLTGAVAEAYLDLDRAYALEDIAADTRAQRARILEITRRRLAAGLDTRVELREAQGELPQAQTALLQAVAAQALARHELAALIGRGADAYAGIGRPHLNPTVVLPLPPALPINLLARRPDVIAARERIEAADAQRRAARAAFYPSINLSALAGFASVSLSQLISAQSLGYGAGAALSLPLFDAGRLRAQYRGAEAHLDGAVADYDATVLAAVHQAADQLTQIDALGAQLQQQAQWLTDSQEAYRLDEERYRAGLASYLSVLNAETEVFNARRQNVELGSARASARIALLVALGGSFQPPGAAPALAADLGAANGTGARLATLSAAAAR